MNITKKPINLPEKKASLAKLYRLERGYLSTHSNQELPEYAKLYRFSLNPRQKAVIGIIIYIELRCAKGFFDAKNSWLLQHIEKRGFPINKSVLNRDLSRLEKLGLIYRNTWSIPQRAGSGRKRQICSAWNLKSFEKNFIFRQRIRKKNDIQPKPKHVLDKFFAYVEKVKKDNRLPPNKGKVSTRRTSINKFHTSCEYKNLYRVKKRGFDKAKPQKSLILHTNKQIIEYLKDPDKQKIAKVFFESSALSDLDKELYPIVLREIVRTNKKVVTTFIKAAGVLDLSFENSRSSCLECLISLYNELNYLLELGKLKNIKNLIAYTLKSFTVKRCIRLLFKLNLPRQKTVYLITTQEIIEFLDPPGQNLTKVFFCSKAQEKLDGEYSKKALRLIGKLHCRGKGWGPCAEDYLEYLCNHVLELVKGGFIDRPKNLISYTLSCHTSARLAKFMDERYHEKIKNHLDKNAC